MAADGSSHGRWMGLDVGTRRVGEALSDPLKLSARPLTAVTRTGDGSDLAQLERLVHEHEIVRLVVGLPRRLDGREGDLADSVRLFIQTFLQRCPLEVVWAEERLSSKEAERLMGELGIPASQRRRRRDAFAAALILQWYLESQ